MPAKKRRTLRPEIVPPDGNEEVIELLESIDSRLDDIVQLFAASIQVMQSKESASRGHDPYDALANLARSLVDTARNRQRE